MKRINLWIVLLSLSLISICFTACKQNPKETSTNNTESTNQRKPPEFEYDDLGRIVQRKDFSYNRDGSIRFKNQYDYKYDERGNRIEEITQSWDLSGKRVVYTIARFSFNDLNLKTEATFQSFDPEGREILWVKNVYDYDNNGYEIRDQQF
ncbi:MAG TPA: hypothetical protein PKU86_00680, partial [Bacteroidales bacterium]|nr:hypothetical protein [Bacteroidales bacterium]